MIQPFRTTRRVEFHETDMAGIMHFSNFFRYMESAEVEFLRSLDLHVSWRAAEERYGFPRVSASCDYYKPARFEDEVEIAVRIDQIGRKSLSYVHEFRVRGELIAKGTITCVFVRVAPGHQLESQEIPADIRDKLTACFEN